jgi:hypothetical protein
MSLISTPCRNSGGAGLDTLCVAGRTVCGSPPRSCRVIGRAARPLDKTYGNSQMRLTISLYRARSLRHSYSRNDDFRYYRRLRNAWFSLLIYSISLRRLGSFRDRTLLAFGGSLPIRFERIPTILLKSRRLLRLISLYFVRISCSRLLLYWRWL